MKSWASANPITYLKRKQLKEGQELTLVRTLAIADQCEKVEAADGCIINQRGCTRKRRKRESNPNP